MVDWSEVTLEFDRLVSLDNAEIERELKAISDRSPETADLLRKQIHKQRLASGFMATRAPDANDRGSSLSQGDRLGPWEVEELIGSGGMGNVYRARRNDGVYDQTVAIKQLHGGGQAQLARFDAERKRLAQLEHPNIARIIDGGTDDAGRPYMAMEFVEGEPINLWADRTSASREMRLRLICELADALAHAHARLVLHRDVKAANVLVNENGQVRLIDFGIATLVDDGGEDEGGIAPLTLAIAAPEQLTGKPVNVGTDIFMVGMLTHHLLAGALPRRNADGSVVVDGQALNNPDLNAIVTKALATEQDERYDSIDAFGDDLEKYLGGFEVAARPLAGLARFNKLLARNKFASGMLAFALTALVLGIVGTSIFAVRANEARIEAEENLANSDHFAADMTVQSDMMQRAFGGAEDQERLAETIIDYQKQALELKSTDPEQAARINYAAATHFMRRQDYPRAIAILEPWLAEGYGSEMTVFDGKGVLARSFMDVGRMAEAAKILREQEKAFRNSSAAFMPSHAAAASQLGIASRQPQDLNLAESVLLKTIEQAPGNDFFGYFYMQLAIISRLKGDFGAMQQYMLKSYEIEKAKGLSETVNLDISIKNLAEMKFYYEGDKVEAERDLANARQLSERKGESAALGYIAMLESAMLRDSGDYAEAEKKTDDALTLFDKFSDADAPYALAARAEKAELAALQGRVGEAQTLLNTVLASSLEGQEAREVQARKKLAQQFINAQSQALRSKIKPLRLIKSEMEMICTNVSLLRRYSNMANEGLVVAHPCIQRLK